MYSIIQPELFLFGIYFCFDTWSVEFINATFPRAGFLYSCNLTLNVSLLQLFMKLQRYL